MHEFPTFVDLLRYRSQSQPDRIAFSFLQEGEQETARWTYGELDQRARAIAAKLQSLGLSGERALLLYAPNLDFIAGFFGCLYANVTAVPAYPPRSAQMLTRLTAIIEDAQAAIALSTRAVLESIDQRMTDVGLTVPSLATDRIEPAEANQWQPPYLKPEHLAFLQYTSGSTGNPKGVMVSHGNLIHNSRQINHSFQDTPETIGVSWLPPYHDMGLIGGILQPIYVGLPMVLMPPVAFLQRPTRWLSAISAWGGTTSGGPNFAYELCLKQIKPEQLEALDLSSWTLAFSGAEPVRAETIEAFSKTFAPCGFRKEAFFPCYGMAETTLIVTGASKAHEPMIEAYDDQALSENEAIAVERQDHDESQRILVSSGRPIAELEVVIVEPETGVKLPDQKVGEIWVASESVAQGYWRKPELTQATFHAIPKDMDGKPLTDYPFLRTGDLGFLKQGELFVAGRLKDLIIIRGRNHYPQDIEASIQEAHPALRVGCGAAFAVEQSGQEKLVVVQEVERTWLRKLEVDAVIQAIRQAIVTHHQLLPDAILLLRTGGIPKTSSGKIQRFACRQQYLEQSLNVVGEWSKGDPPATPPATPPAALPAVSLTPATPSRSRPNPASKQSRAIQTWLVETLAAQTGLAIASINPQEPLSLYGLDSLAAVRLTADLEDWLTQTFEMGHRLGLSPTLAYDYPTIQQLSDHVSTLVGGGNELAEASLPGELDPSIQTDDIAIIGFGCRFPGAENPDAYWDLLQSGGSGISKLTDPDWQGDRTLSRPAAIQGGFLPHVDLFDAEFFGISPREAEQMDPQQRLLLEVAWESLEHAGLSAEKLAGTQTGVFVGISSSDYAQLKSGDITSVYAGTGNAHSVAANRLSYFLDLRGPSLAVDTACSSSLVAIHLASQSLRHGDCHQAIAAGVNILLDAALTDTFQQSGMLSPDGQCKTFDQAADGYVRGEGCGVVILKRLSEAERDGDQIWGVIRGSAINQDGRSNGLTAPNGRAQQAVIQQAIARARLTPNQISYVEAHGTGTALGDPIEVNAIQQALSQGRDQEPCWIGSVKTNLGHLEAAAGVAGLIKVLLALNHKAIPPHLNFSTLNPLIQFDHKSFQIPTQIQTWSDPVRHAGVSSFGFGGTNAHLIVSSAPARKERPQTCDRPWHLLTLSAKNETALRALQQCYAERLAQNPARWGDLCTSVNGHRTALGQRTALIAPADINPSLIQQALRTGKSGNELASGSGLTVLTPPRTATPSSPKCLAFMFTGQGAQYPEMGRELYQTSPQFRQWIETCDRLLKDDLQGQSLIEILYLGDNQTTSQRIHQTAITQPALFALEYALAQLWISWGIHPDWVMGHSVGEYVAACIAGVFTLEEGLKLIATRARLMETVPQSGGMLIVFAKPEWVQAQLSPFQGELVIAAYNGPENTVVSGHKRAIAQFEIALHQQGQKCKRLSVSQAFHSPLMEPVIAAFRTVAQTINFQPPQIPIISNLTSLPIAEDIATADYWCNHILAPVKFSQTMATLQDQGVATYLEIGPKPTLIGMGRRCLTDDQDQWLPSLRFGRSDWQQLLESLGQLYLQGFAINWPAVDSAYAKEKVSLPTYPWQRQRYWVEGLGQSNPQFQAQSRSQATVEQRYTREWQPSALTANVIPQAGQWIFWGAEPDYAALRHALPDHQSLLLVNDGDQTFQQSQYWEVDSTSVESLVQFLKHQAAQLPILGLIDARRLMSPQSLGLDHAIDAEATLHYRLITLVQAIAQTSTQARLWAISPSLDEQTLNASIAIHGSVSGLAKGIALEHPESWGGLLLLKADTVGQSWDAIAQEINRPSRITESVILIDPEQRYVERLRPVNATQPPDETSFQPVCQPQSLYLISGGLGALGLETAQWMIAQGAQYLMLVGRSLPGEEAWVKIQAWQSQGVTVDTISLDIGQSDSLARLRQAIASTPVPLKGIIHAAGVLDDAMVMNLTQGQFNRVFEAKMKGAWMLHELSLDFTLDFFVCYSSVAAVLGSPGQSHYAAANAGLDALAAYRQNLGLPGLSVNWGPWADSGMATSKRASRSLKSFGFDFLTPAQNFEHLAFLLQNPAESTVGVFNVNWSEFQKHPGTQSLQPFLSEILSHGLENAPEKISPRLNGIELKTLSHEERADQVLIYLRQTLAKLMEVSLEEIQPHDHLMEMGTDSLLVMDAIALIQKDLDLMIYPREIYEHPHLDRLAHYLSQEFQRIHCPGTQSVESPPQDMEKIQAALNALAYATADQRKTETFEQKLPPAVFILSSPRAGSTLLRVMLAGNSHLFSPPELHLLPFRTMADRAVDLKTSHLGEGLQRSLMDLANLDAEASQALIQKWEQEQKPIAAVYEELQRLVGDRLLVDKSPTYGMQLDHLNRAEALFENAKFIHLVRHPYAMIDSFAKLRMEKLIGMSEADPHQVAEEIWTRSNQNILAFGQTVSDRYHQVSYETLVEQPQATLESLCEFLEIPFDAQMLNPYEGDRLTDGVFQQSMSVGDPNFQNHSTIEAKLAKRWQQIQLPHPLQTQTLNLAQQFDYALPHQAQSHSVLHPSAIVADQPVACPASSALSGEDTTLEMREHILHVRGLDICLCEWGPKDGTPILCLHGILDQGLVWEPVAMALAKAGYRVIAPDLRGHGKSAHVGPGGAYHLMDFLGDVVSLVENIVDRPMYLVGHSLGSVVAGIFTRVRSQLVRHLILVEPVLPHNSQNEDLMDSMNTFLEYTLTPPQHKVMKDIAMAADRLRKAIPSLSLPFAKRLAERGTKPHGNGLIWRWDAILRARMSLTQQGGPITRDSYLRLLSEIQVPLTTIYGNNSTFNRPEDLDEQKAAIPHANRVVISGGHNLALEAPADLVRCILDAVPRLGPSSPRSPEPRVTP